MYHRAFWRSQATRLSRCLAATAGSSKVCMCAGGYWPCTCRCLVATAGSSKIQDQAHIHTLSHNSWSATANLSKVQKHAHTTNTHPQTPPPIHKVRKPTRLKFSGYVTSRDQTIPDLKDTHEILQFLNHASKYDLKKNHLHVLESW